MKKTLLMAAIIAFTVASCKKDRTCTCTLTAVSSTVNGVSQPINPSTHTTVSKITKVTKKGAACTSGDKTTTTTDVSGGITYTTIDVDKAECKLD